MCGTTVHSSGFNYKTIWDGFPLRPYGEHLQRNAIRNLSVLSWALQQKHLDYGNVFKSCCLLGQRVGFNNGTFNYTWIPDVLATHSDSEEYPRS